MNTNKLKFEPGVEDGIFSWVPKSQMLPLNVPSVFGVWKHLVAVKFLLHQETAAYTPGLKTRRSLNAGRKNIHSPLKKNLSSSSNEKHERKLQER